MICGMFTWKEPNENASFLPKSNGISNVVRKNPRRKNACFNNSRKVKLKKTPDP